MKENQLDLLADLYNHKGWKHFDSYVRDKVIEAQMKVKKRSTPTKEVDFARGEWHALEAVLDKVEQDKINKEQTRD